MKDSGETDFTFHRRSVREIPFCQQVFFEHVYGFALERCGTIDHLTTSKARSNLRDFRRQDSAVFYVRW